MAVAHRSCGSGQTARLDQGDVLLVLRKRHRCCGKYFKIRSSSYFLLFLRELGEVLDATLLCCVDPSSVEEESRPWHVQGEAALPRCPAAWGPHPPGKKCLREGPFV